MSEITIFVAGFIGSAAMNFVSGEVAGGELVTPLGRIPRATLSKEAGDGVKPGPVVVGVRAGDCTERSIDAAWLHLFDPTDGVRVGR